MYIYMYMSKVIVSMFKHVIMVVTFTNKIKTLSGHLEVLKNFSIWRKTSNHLPIWKYKILLFQSSCPKFPSSCCPSETWWDPHQLHSKMYPQETLYQSTAKNVSKLHQHCTCPWMTINGNCLQSRLLLQIGASTGINCWLWTGCASWALAVSTDHAASLSTNLSYNFCASCKNSALFSQLCEKPRYVDHPIVWRISNTSDPEKGFLATALPNSIVCFDILNHMAQNSYNQPCKDSEYVWHVLTTF